MSKKQQTKKMIAVMSFVLITTLLFVPNMVLAGDPEPTNPPSEPTMKTLDQVEPRIPITSVPYIVTQPGSYYLTGDMVLPSATVDAGISINASNVSIDFQGHNLIGPGQTAPLCRGVLCIFDYENIELRNGTITQFSGGGIVLDGTGHRMINMRINANTSRGIDIDGGGTLIKDCTVYNNDIGFGFGAIHVGNAATIVNNTVHDNTGHGISTSGGSTIINNTAYNNGLAGIATRESTITGNTTYGNSYHGISAFINSSVMGNTANNNQRHGIEISSGCLVDGNTAMNNNQSGENYQNLFCNTGSCDHSTLGINHAP